MKSTITLSVLLIAFIISTCSVAQTTTKPYKEGSVWSVSFIKLKPNMGDDYLKSIGTTWRKAHEEAVKQGLITSFRIFSGEASSPGDWDIMLVTEYKNMGAMDNISEKWDSIFTAVIGSEDATNKLNQSRLNLRDIYGSKILREIIYN